MDGPGLVRRPKRGETDEELIRMQEDFLRSGEKPSVQLVRAKREGEPATSDGTAKSSEPLAGKWSPKGSSPHGSSLGAPRTVFQPPEVDHVQVESVLCDVVERNVSADIVKPPSGSSAPFPKPTKVSGCASAGHKQSLFASRLKKENGGARQFISGPSSASAASTGLPKDDFEAVHLENLDRLAAMSHEEKLKAQKELLSRLNPATVAFLKSRNQQQKASQKTGTVHAGEKSQNLRGSVGSGVAPGATNLQASVASALFSSQRQQKTVGEETPNVAAEQHKPEHKPEAKPEDKLEHKPEDKPEDNPELHVDSLGAGDAQVPILDEDELPIKPSEASKWLNMNTVEEDKLQWMTMLPPVKAAEGSQNTAPCVGRFNFDGELVPPDQEVPVHQGLHHHGKDAERAGYSSAEILRLLRSQVRSQRLLALQLLERILTKHWLGHYTGRLEGDDLLTQLLQSGLAPLLRSALDDRATLESALLALQALLVSQPQQALFGRAFLWQHGYRTFFLKPVSEYGNASEIPDADFSQIDLVQALLRMDLLPRLHYILKTCLPGASSVAAALLVIARVAQHSVESATKVLNHPNLMDLIFKEFLPASWTSPAMVKGKVAKAYGNPMWPALELVRTLAAAGRELAEALMQRYNLHESLVAYLALEPSSSQLPASDCLNLALEALRTWRILLAYNLGGDVFFELFSVVARRLQLFSALDLDGVPFDLEYCALLLHCLAALTPEVKKSTLAGLGPSLNFICTRWLTLLARFTDPSTIQTGLHAVAALLHCLCSLCEVGVPPNPSVVDALQLVLNSKFAVELSSQLRNCSFLLVDGSGDEGKPTPKGVDDCLPCVCAEESDLSRAVNVAPLELTAAVAKFLYTLRGQLKQEGKEVVDNSTLRSKLSEAAISLLCSPGIKAYLDQLCLHAKWWTVSGGQRWLCRLEFNLLYELMRLAVCESLDQNDAALYHEVALALVATCPPGFQYEHFSLLKAVVFAPSFAGAESSTVRTLLGEDASVTELESVTGHAVPLATLSKLDSARLSSIKNTYVKLFDLGPNQRSDSCVSLTRTKRPLFPCDWVYLPVESLCNLEESPASYDREDVLSCLRWAGHLLQLRHRFMRSFAPLVHFTRLASVFLAGPELFLDLDVQATMLSLLRLLEQTKLLCRMQRHLDLKDWPGLPPFSDLHCWAAALFWTCGHCWACRPFWTCGHHWACLPFSDL
ncbi:RNA polymerase II-associated protein 1 isoform X2 [Haemaphysalis longicornis]